MAARSKPCSLPGPVADPAAGHPHYLWADQQGSGEPDLDVRLVRSRRLSITWNRFWIVIFAIAVFFALLAVLKRTPLGLQMRAVTSNRRMASAMGFRTPFVDAMTFGSARALRASLVWR